MTDMATSLGAQAPEQERTQTANATAPFSYQQILIALTILLMLVLRTILAGTLGLGDDEALLLHLLRQSRERLLHLVLHLHLRRVRVGALHERHRDRRTPGRGG